jgi:hypothetical protein
VDRLRIGYAWVTDGLETGLEDGPKIFVGTNERLVGVCRSTSARGTRTCQNGLFIFYHSFLTAIGFGLYWLAESDAG